MQTKYDVIIVGGGTAGVSCAWNCAKYGLKTLLVEKNSFLGGSITSALVTPAMKTSENAINTNFFEKLYGKLLELGGAITYNDNNKGWFNIELTKIALDMLLTDVGVDILFESRVSKINYKENKILSVCIETLNDNNALIYKNLLLEPIETNSLVDATGFAYIFQNLNADFLKNSSDDFQPNSLRFIMSGINYHKFAQWLLNYDTNRDVTSCTTYDSNPYVSTAYTWDTNKDWALKPLFAKAIADNILTEEDCNYFQIFSIAGAPDSIAFNAPRILKNSSNPYIKGRISILRLSKFCKKYLPGFENAYISNIANSLGVRFSKCIKGKYIYTYEDLISGKTFKNPVLRSNYPVDIHSNKKNKSILKRSYNEYELPLEALMAKDYDNLYAIGRCISADFKAQAALRIIPSCFSMGEGLAKYLARININ